MSCNEVACYQLNSPIPMISDISKSIADYFSNRPEIIAVYLFGSHAHDKGLPTSDVDIAVLFAEKDMGASKTRSFKYMQELSRMLRKDIHLIVMNDTGEELLRQIFSKGKCVQLNNRQALSYYRSSAFVRIADFGFYRKAFQAGLIRRLKRETANG